MTNLLYLSRRSKQQLNQLLLSLFPEFKYVRFTKSKVILKKNSYSLRRKTYSIIDLLFYHIPTQLSIGRRNSRSFVPQIVAKLRPSLATDDLELNIQVLFTEFGKFKFAEFFQQFALDASIITPKSTILRKLIASKLDRFKQKISADVFDINTARRIIVGSSADVSTFVNQLRLSALSAVVGVILTIQELAIPNGVPTLTSLKELILSDSMIRFIHT